MEILAIVITLIGIVITFWLYFILPAQMAKKRNRSALVWILIGIIFSPLVSIFGLLVLGQGVNGAM